MGRGVQIVVLQGYNIVLCQTLLFSILNVAFPLLLGLDFQFFKGESFPAPNFWEKKSLHMGVNNLDEGGARGRGRERSAASWHEQHSHLSLQPYLQLLFFALPPFVSSNLWSDIKTALLVWDPQWPYFSFISFLSFVFFSMWTQSVNWCPVVGIKAISCHIETPSSQ